MLPTEPAHDRDEEHLGQVDPVGVVRARLHHSPRPLRSASMHQCHADQVDAGDGPDVERDHDRLEGIRARAEPRHHVVNRQVVPDLGGHGRRQSARHDEQHVCAEPVVELVEIHGDDHAGHQIELVRGHLARGPVALHPRRHQAPVHGGHERDLHEATHQQQEPVVAGGLAQQHEEQREQRVELQEDQQVVELVVAGPEQVEQMDGVRPRCAVLAGQADQEVDDGPAQVRHGHQREASAPEGAVIDARQVPDAVGEHAGRDEEERLPGHVQQLQRCADSQPRRRRERRTRACGSTPHPPASPAAWRQCDRAACGCPVRVVPAKAATRPSSPQVEAEQDGCLRGVQQAPLDLARGAGRHALHHTERDRSLGAHEARSRVF